jgi:RHS repeat-associated protein
MRRAILAILAILVTVLSAASLPTTGSPVDSPGAPADSLSDTTQSILRREPQVRPDAWSNGSLQGLQYADPTEQLMVMSPPEPNNQGSAELSHPLRIPPGRGGFQPNLEITYSSAAGNGWLGTGWDLSVGAIEVDTRWGVPRFDHAKETETYTLGGQVLNPTAVRADWQDRVADRSDFTRRVETQYELIIRHGNSPKNYWWEVRDKMGGIRWYGGYPDDGGPSVDAPAKNYTSLKQDPSAILFDDNGNAFRWALSAQRDVGVNMIRYFYDPVAGQRVGTNKVSLGRQLYLKRILYTAAAEASPAGAEDPAYEVRFLRDGAISPAPTPRTDVIVDARGGFLQVTSDLLRRVEIWYGAPKATPGAERDYNILSRRYDLIYQEGAYGKTLLKEVRQLGSDEATYGSHTFAYYDEVRNASGAYNGFGPEVTWNSGTDNLEGNAITPVPVSALGASETNGGDVHAYIGFNPTNPTKNGSFGGAFTINGGATEALAEMLDINGDGLPDKIFRLERNGPIYYRLNSSGPGRIPTFSGRRTVSQLNKLSTEWNIGLAGSLEAYFGIMVQFMIAGAVTVGEEYFTDVNGDGLPDFVSAGTVYFNHLDPLSGDPTFESDSANTQTPITTGGATLPPIQAIQDLETQRRQQSPLQDTVRRWVAPFSGEVTISAPVSLEPPIASGNLPYTGDGVRVAIQHNGTQLWSSTLLSAGSSATPALAPLTVTKGDRLYFRVGAIDDGARDQVRWDPAITYTGNASPDANGLSQLVYRGSSDFTLAGRPNTVGMMPLKGRVKFEGTLYKSKVTSDDVTVLVVKNGTPVFQQLIPRDTVSVAGIPLSGDFLVASPTDTTRDTVEVRIAVDSPIDVTVLRLDHTLYYIEADPVNGQQIPLTGAGGAPTLVLQIPAGIDIYPANSLVAPQETWVSNMDGTVTAHASITIGPDNGGGDVFVTVKDEAGLVAKHKIAVADSGSSQDIKSSFSVAVVNGRKYWFDFSIRNPDLSDKAANQSIQLDSGNSAAPVVVLGEQAKTINTEKMSLAGRLAYMAASGRLDLAIATVRERAAGTRDALSATVKGIGRGDDEPDGGRAGAPSELSIAVDATGRHIVVGATDPRGYSLNPVSASGFAYSDDGGVTWMDGGPLPVTTGTSTLGGARLPQVFGNPEVKYLGGSNFVCFSIMVKKYLADQAVQTLGFHRSTDFGHTWTGPFEVTAATNPHGLLTGAGTPRDAADKPFADVDPDTGRVMLSWNNFTTEAPGQEMSAAYSDNLMDAVPVWSKRVVISSVDGDQNAIMPRFAGGASRQAFVTWPRGTSTMLARSADNGATWSEPVEIVGTGSGIFPRMAIDNSGGVNQGSVYLVYVADNDGDGADIAFQRSNDGGRTFSAPVLLNSSPGSDRVQWIPWVTVDRDTGRVHVSYFDQDVARSGDLTGTAHLFSDDGGRTWTKPVMLSERPFHAGNTAPGDYNQAVAQNGELYAVWAGGPGFDPSGADVPDINFRRVFAGQAALRAGAASFIGSNGNDSLVPGGQVALNLPLENYVTNTLNRAPISGITAALSSGTPGVSVEQAGSAYPDLAPGDAAENSSRYLIRLDPSYVPGTRIDLTLKVSSSESAAVLLYTLRPSMAGADSGPVSAAAAGNIAGEQAEAAVSTGASAGPGGVHPGEGVEAAFTPAAVPAVTGRVLATADVPSVLNWAGRQGAFPISYRGWGYAGYNGDGARATQSITESDFDLKADQFPQTQTQPTTYQDPNFKDASKGNAFVFLPARVDLRDASDQVIGTLLAWKGVKDSILGAAELIRTSRRGADSPSLGIATGGSVQAVRRVGVTAPVFSLTGGIGPASAGFAAGPSFGLLDYMDLNGDGFPDIVAPGYVKYTGPRGGFFEDGPGVSIVNQDMTFEVAGGVSADGLSIKSNSQGDVGTAQKTAPVSGTAGKSGAGGAATSGGSASKSEYGASVGGSFGITASFTNPNSPDPNWSGGTDTMPSDRTAPMEQALADVNGDGLPDRVIATPQGVYVRFNLGYRFSDTEVAWSNGGFENNESYAGSVGGSLGFTMPTREFSAGLGLSEAINVARYAWVDVDGDGILDRLHKNNTADSPITVGFGTNSGLMPDVAYGQMAQGAFDLLGAQIPVGQQIALGRSRGVGAGFDFTIGVGPLCIAACYLIINPGVHFDHSISSSQIQLVDIDGDGYPDSVKSTADNQILVRFNNHGRTNLLKEVHNPLGGSIRLGYRRDGNTVSQPASVWTLSSVEVDDGRPGDGVDVQLSTYEYSDGRYNRLEREMLGYGAVTERQRAFAADGDVSDDPVIRVVRRDYSNSTVFDSGLLLRQAVLTPAGAVLQETKTTYSLIDLATKAPANLAATQQDPAGLRLLTMAVAPLQTKVEQRWFEAGGGVGQETWTTYEYDGLGNVVRQVDVGEPELADDDLVVSMQYTTCSNASDSGNYKDGPWACPAQRPAGGVPPYWHDQVCPTWTSLPAMFTATTAGGTVLRKRNGAPALCDNSSVTDLKEFFGPGTNDYAESLLSYDEWGSYNHIEYPENAAGERLVVDYVYDDKSHANVANTTDSHGLNATSEFDGRTGRIASRTDANGQKTTYTYDRFGRLETITGPLEQGTGRNTVRFEYNTGAAYPYAVARHFDTQHPSNTIDTATFVDGIGRRTQTKRDGTVFQGAAATPADAMLVSPAVEYDALGRIVKTRYPVSETTGTIGNYNASTAGLATTTEWDLLDRQTRVVIPDGSTTTTAYSFGGAADFGAKLFRTTVTDALGKPQTSWSDVRNRVIAVDDEAAGQTRVRTRYSYDAMGQLVRVTDNGGNASTYTYDILGRTLATQTPDGGLVENRWDGAGNLVAKITPNLRRNGRQITYSYDIDRLVGVDYPDATPDITYTYGDPGAPGNAVGRITAVLDGARSQQLTYDKLGEAATEVDAMILNNGATSPFTTAFTRDSLGRVLTITYPDGEILSHRYDSGGLLSSMQGARTLSAGLQVTDYLRRMEYDEFQSMRYQEFGNGTRTEFAFDPATRRLSRQMTDAPARRVQDLNYSYDRVGNVLKMDNTLPPPQTDLKGGPSTQTYRYDPFYRLLSANGTAPQAPNKQRDYTFALTYDINGNIRSKVQTDTTSGVTSSGTLKSPKQETATTYTYNPMAYSPTRPHQLTGTGAAAYTYDDNGNLVRIVDSKGKLVRAITRDAADHVIRIDDASSSTDYRYDHLGLLGVQRDSLGETGFVNDWYTVTNQGWAWRQIWAGEDRIAQATEHVNDLGVVTQFHYYQHEDLQGTTNLVTDAQGLVFEHNEYFPAGELWITEKSTTHRTPYRYVGAYNDEVRNLDSLGQRWYEPREQMFYNPEPLLYDEPESVIADPALLPAYTYAESNPLKLFDDDGLASKTVFSRLGGKLGGLTLRQRTGRPMQKLSAQFTKGQALSALNESKRHSRLWQSLVRFSISERADKLNAFKERFSSKPLLEFQLDSSGGAPRLKKVSVSNLFATMGEWDIKSASPAKSRNKPTRKAAAGSRPAPPASNP